MDRPVAALATEDGVTELIYGDKHVQEYLVQQLLPLLPGPRSRGPDAATTMKLMTQRRSSSGAGGAR